MKKLLFPCLLLLSACAKKDPAPDYADFTPISGQFTIHDGGFVRYNKRDTTAVLTNLQLRISRGTTTPKVLDTYEFRGTFSAHETYDIRISTDHSSAGAGAWTGLQEEDVVSVDGKPYSYGGSSNSASLSASGNTFTASFDNSGAKGTLK